MAEVFHVTHDANNWNEYDSGVPPGGSKLALSAASALGGSAYGVGLDVAAAGISNVGKDASGINNSATIIRFGFRMNLNSIVLNTSTGELLFELKPGGGLEFNEFIVLRENGSGGFNIEVSNFDDAGLDHTINTTTLPAGDITIEVVWEKPASTSSNDGVCTVFVNGAQSVTTTTLDNFDNFDDMATSASSTFSIFPGSNGGGSDSGTLYLDEFIIRDDSTPIYPASTAFRLLGFAADNENLYATGLKDAATLKLYNYDLPTLTEAGTASFGSGTDGELDAQTRGIFPVIKPMADLLLYLRGRDGNDVQVQYNDQNGTLGWVDIGPGTATWATDKYAAGLLTAPTYTDDVVAVFSDDDVYRTRFGTVTWVKIGDADSGLRAAARHPNRFNEIMVGGTAAGTVEWSNNFGATFGDVSGTALGTVNSFEVSL